MIETGCATCTKQRHMIGWALQDISGLRGVLRTRGTAGLAGTLRKRVAHRDELTAELERHQASEECTRVEVPNQILDVRPAPKGKSRDAGKPRCPVCRHTASLLPTGYLRKHKDPKGYPCANRRPADVTALQLDELPVVTLPPVASPPRGRRAPAVREPLGLARYIDPNYVATGACNCCGKRVTGERRLCGLCAALPKDKRPSPNVPALCHPPQTMIEKG